MREKIDDNKRDGAIGYDSGSDSKARLLNEAIDRFASSASILSNLSYSLVGMVQTKFIGEFGAEGLAALGAGQRIFCHASRFDGRKRWHYSAVARAWGAGDYEEAVE